MNLPFAAGCVALVAAYYLWPAWPGFHTWQYAAALALLAAPLGRDVASAVRAPRVQNPANLAMSLGALLVAIAGLACGLLGPDTQTLARPPGTVAPLPDLGAAAFFPNVAAAELARGDARVLVRRRNAAEVAVGPGERRFFGTAALTVDMQTAAYVAARDARGERLTVTQPSNAAFLSPVLLFAQRVTIAGQALPADTFAAPAARRRIKAFYFSKTAIAQQSHGVHDREAVLFALDAEDGKPVPGGIGFARSGEEAVLGGLRLRPTLGAYPALVISAVPYPPAAGFGGLLFAGGLLYRAVGARRLPRTERDLTPAL